MANTFSFEDGLGPTAQRKPTLVPASRTKQTSGKLTLGDVGGVSSVVGKLPKDRGILDTIRKTAAEFQVPEEYLFALADQESGYNPAARNAEFGATGIMQYIPSSAAARGIDPSDPTASIRAAAKDFAEQMNQGGTEWAIKHHFAGPNTKGHGPKTRQYLADVNKRAQDIRALLDAQEEVDAGEVGGSTDAGPKQPVGTFSFEDGLGASAPKVVKQQSENILDQAKPILGAIGSAYIEKFSPEAQLNAAKTALDKGWRFIQRRIADKPDEFLGQKVNVVERTPEEIDRYIKENPWIAPKGLHFTREGEQQALREQLRYVRVADERGKPVPAQQEAKKGFFANLENPLKLLTEDSLPANIVEYIANLPVEEGRKFLKARQVMQQEKIIANPAKYSAQEVADAQAAIAERDAKQSAGVREMWNDLKQAAKEDPGRFGAQLANAIVADPELIAAPEGIGLKIARGVERVATGATAASRAARIADKVIDAGSTGAALNLGIEAASAASEGRELTTGEAGAAAAIGGGASVLFAGIFSRGKIARDNLTSNNINLDTYEGIIRDIAREDLAVEQVINAPETIPTDIRAQIEESLGITNMTAAERKRWHAARQKESKTFQEQSLEADYLKFKAEERIARRTQLAEDAAAAEARNVAEAAKQAEVDRAFQQRQQDRLAQQAADYEKALAERDRAAASETEDAAYAEDNLRDATAKLDEQEIFEASLNSDVPAIRQAMNRAARRDSQLARPKWQRGEVDPRLVTRLGIGSLFAGTAFAVAPEDSKLQTAFAAGLAGLTVPGVGGSVLRRMRQAGAISADGEILALARLVKDGKLKPTREVGEVAAREAELINLAKQGDQRAYKELYDEHYPRIERFVRKYVREAGPRLGIEAADVAQEAFVKAFRNLDKFEGGSQFSTWLHSIAKNEGLMAVRDAKNLKGGSEFDIASAERPDVVTPFGERYSRDAFDEGLGANLEDTPETQALRQESETVLMNAVERLPEAQRRAFLMSRVEQYTAQEIADATNQNLSTVLMQIKTAQDKVLDAVEKGLGAKKSPVKLESRVPRTQRGEIDPRLLKVGAVATLGAAAGAFLNEQNQILGATYGAFGLPIVLLSKGIKPKIGAAIGAVGAGAYLAKDEEAVSRAAIAGGVVGTYLVSRGKSLRRIKRLATDRPAGIIPGIDYTAGVLSTRTMNISKPLWFRVHEVERRKLLNTHKYNEKVHPFLVKLADLPKTTREVISRAILTGDPRVTDRLLQAINDPTLIDSWKSVRSVLDSLKDQLVALGRFKPNAMEYFPRIVKDYEGLVKALGKQRGTFMERSLKEADVESIRNRGTALNEIERSVLINKMLLADRKASQQPGFAKDRVIEEITPELQQFYYTPAESLHTYIRSAVSDIERAKFFGKDIAVITKKGQEYTDVDKSVGNVVDDLIATGKLKEGDAENIHSMLRSHFLNGEVAPSEFVQDIKNVSYAGLLGNFASAGLQASDVFVQAYVQDVRSALSAIARTLTGTKKIHARDFGLVDHIAEEFASQSSSAKAVNRIFKTTLFSKLDLFSKDVALNAAVIRMGRLVKSEGGIKQLQLKYKEYLAPGEIDQLVKDLRNGEMSDIVHATAFAEMTRTHPVTRFELPQAYLDNPDGRLLYQYKTYMIKQIDLARRDAYNEFKAGNRAKALKNLAEIGLVMGLSGATGSMIQDFIKGKDVKFELTDIPVNALKTFGLSQYFLDTAFGVSKEEAKERRKVGDYGRAQEPAPVEAVLNTAAPPYKVFEELLRGDPKATKYIPLIGKTLEEKRKAREKEK